MARTLLICLNWQLLFYFVYASSDISGKAAGFLVCVFACHISDVLHMSKPTIINIFFRRMAYIVYIIPPLPTLAQNIL